MGNSNIRSAGEIRGYAALTIAEEESAEMLNKVASKLIYRMRNGRAIWLMCGKGNIGAAMLISGVDWMLS